MKIKGRIIFCETGFHIARTTEVGKTGLLFIFSDLNPSVEFRRTLSRKQMLLLVWFFFRSMFVRM